MQLQIKGIKKEQYAKYLELLPDIKREKAQKYITIVLTLSTAIILGLFAINPTFSTIANLQKQIADNNFVQQQLQQKITNLALLQQQYGNLKSDLPIVYNAVPQDTQLALFVAEVQSIAKNTSLTLAGLQITTINLSTLSSSKQNSFDYTITANGTYQDMINFLSEMTSFQRATDLNDIILTNQNGTLELSVKGTVYFKK
jgi:Tfp pilus assembly protein PilO